MKIIKKLIGFILVVISIAYMAYMRFTSLDITPRMQWNLYKYNYLIGFIVFMIGILILIKANDK